MTSQDGLDFSERRIDLIEAKTERHFQALASNCRTYAEWCRERYSDVPDLLDDVFGHQSLNEELNDMAQKYRAPAGRAMLAMYKDTVVGGGAYRRHSAAACELKRLYVSAAARQAGIGRRLTSALISAAAADGYTFMLLDTGKRLTEAISMYESMGFAHVHAYQDYPERVMPYLVFMGRPITATDI